MTRPLLIPAALALAVLLAAAPAWGQTGVPCMPHTEFLDRLSKKYGESPVAMGITAGGRVLEVVASENGSWTIIVTMPNGISCGLGSGHDWQDVPPTLEEAPEEVPA